MLAAGKHTLSGAYFLHGEEEFIKENAVATIVNGIDSALRELNMDVLDSAEATALIAACETLPLMAEQRLVLCRALPKDADGERIIKYIPNIAPSTLLIFSVKGKADGRSSFVKAMSKLDRAVEFAPLNELEAKRYIQKQAKLLDAPITDDTAAFFVALAGCNAAALFNELNKAADYAGKGNDITKNIVSKVVTRDVDYIVFEVLDHFLAGRAVDGMKVLYGLMAEGEKPIQIAERLREKAKLIIQARELIDKRTDKDEITRRLGVSPKYAWHVCKGAQRLSREQLNGLTAAAKALADVTVMQLTGKARAEDALIYALMLCR